MHIYLCLIFISHSEWTLLESRPCLWPFPQCPGAESALGKLTPAFMTSRLTAVEGTPPDTCSSRPLSLGHGLHWHRAEPSLSHLHTSLSADGRLIDSYAPCPPSFPPSLESPVLGWTRDLSFSGAFLAAPAPRSSPVARAPPRGPAAQRDSQSSSRLFSHVHWALAVSAPLGAGPTHTEPAVQSEAESK